MPESDNLPEPTPGAGSSRPSENRTTFGGPRASNAGESLLPGTLIDHRFTLTRLIGRGGMGVVWEAHDTSLGREVALKFLGNEVAADPEAVADLQRETRRSLELTHPNIVRVYDYVEDQELRLVGISMELLTGRSLQMLKLEQPERAFSPHKVLPWLRQICIALDYAHQVVGVVHRDLKPGNLFLNDKGTLKIVDFGIAMVMRDSTSRLVQEARLSRSGTLAYMSQQQLKGDKPTPADDMYSLGAVLYELFTSKPPFFRGDAHALMMQIMSQPPMSIADRQAEMGVNDIVISPAWEAAIMACLSKDAAARPTSGGELLSLIENPAVVLEKTALVDLDSTRLASNVPSDPEKTMLVGRTPAHPPEPKAPPVAPPPLPPPLKENLKIPPPVSPPPPKVPKATPADIARKEHIVVVPANEKRKGGVWGWLGMMGELLGLKSAIVAGVLLFITGLLGWLRSNGSHTLIVKIEPSEVGAQIHVDGKSVGPNPAPATLKIPDLPDGDHVVAVEARGYKRFESGVTMRNGHGELDVKLSPLVGALELTARPGSHVTIEPKEGGKPITRDVGASGKVFVENLPVGEAIVRVEHPDSQVGYSDPVNIAADQTRRVLAQQKILPATVSIKTEPAGAMIYINGASRGTAPKAFSDITAETNLNIEARLDGYETARETYTFKPGERRDLSFDLRQIKGSLTVRARPGTRVSARRFGQNALELGTVGSAGETTFSGISQGRWSLVFEHPDCQPASPTDITINQSGTATVVANQSLLPGSLDVRSDPSGGAIWINGTNHGNTPNVVEGLPSETPLSIELRARGRNNVTRTVTLRPRENPLSSSLALNPSGLPHAWTCNPGILSGAGKSISP